MNLQKGIEVLLQKGYKIEHRKSEHGSMKFKFTKSPKEFVFVTIHITNDEGLVNFRFSKQANEDFRSEIKTTLSNILKNMGGI